MKMAISLTTEAKFKVYKDLSRGSDPRGTFFLMVSLSTLIAAFGLIMDSTAVVIGAMLVAPLMTPILGLALALVRGDARLLGLALRSEVLGIGVAVLASALLGMSLPYFEATPEMLSRTTPNLLDLLVAVCAGLAGAYALVDEKLSPALPGVAISTAIVPPLANCGLCISLGAYQGAWGSFLLFFANFLSILLASAFIFYLAGMARELRVKTGLTMARRFGVAVTGFIVVATLLSSEMFLMLEHRRVGKEIRAVLKDQQSGLRISTLENLVHEETQTKVSVLAEVKAQRVVTPAKVRDLENQLAERLGKSVDLFLQTTVSHGVSASGSINQKATETLDGFSVKTGQDQDIQILQTAEQVLREYLDDKLGVHLGSLEGVPFGGKTILVAGISGVRPLRLREINEIEDLIQNRLAQLPISLITLQLNANLMDKDGRFRTEFSMRRAPTKEEQLAMDSLIESARAWFSEHRFWLDGWSIMVLNGQYHALFEVKGPDLFTPKSLDALDNHLAERLDIPTEVFVRSQLEAVVGQRGYTSFESLLDEFQQRTRAAYDSETKEAIIKTR